MAKAVMAEALEYRSEHIANFHDYQLKFSWGLKADCDWKQFFEYGTFEAVSVGPQWDVDVKLCMESAPFLILGLLVLLIPLGSTIRFLCTRIPTMTCSGCKRPGRDKSDLEQPLVRDSLQEWKKIRPPLPPSGVTDQDVQNKHCFFSQDDIEHSPSLENVLSKGPQANLPDMRIFIEYIFQEHAEYAGGCCNIKRLFYLEIFHWLTFTVVGGAMFFFILLYNLAFIHLSTVQGDIEVARPGFENENLKWLDFILLHPGWWVLAAMITYGLFLCTQIQGAGHSCVRYTLLQEDGVTIDQRIADLRNVSDQDGHPLLEMYEAPGDYFFGAPSRSKSMPMKGGVFSRSYCTIRIDRDKNGRGLDPHKIWAMHHYFESLRYAHAGNHQQFGGILGYDFFGIVKTVLCFWFPTMKMNQRENCAQFVSRGLFLAGVLSRPQLFPKAIWVSMFEQIVVDKETAHATIIYYKQIARNLVPNSRLKMLVHSFVTPIQIFKNEYYRKLEAFADIVVEVRKESNDMLVAYATPAQKSKRPSCFTMFFLATWHQFFIYTMCLLWLLFGWPSQADSTRSPMGGFGSRVLTALTCLAVNAILY